MNFKRKWKVILPVLLSAAVILAGGLYYISSVQDALWNRTVLDILEVTAQGRHALDTYMEKDMETLHLLSADLGEESSQDREVLHERIRQYDKNGASYICVDLDDGIVYTNLLDKGHALGAEQLDIFRKLEGKGMRQPFLDGRTGVWTIGCYERFSFADGKQGYVQKTQPLAELADRFSLSFYNNTGFSYVVDQAGDILIRSQHRNSNRTFQNLFDIIDLQGNDARQVDTFREALQTGKRGVARFRYQNEDYVFCYVPLENAAGWYVVSIIPNCVIMEQANDIVQHSRAMMVCILASVFVLTAFVLVYRRSMRRVLWAEEEARKAAESANIAKSRFLSNMSHDIRTPMNAIIGMTKLAADHADEPEKVRGYLKNIGLSSQLLVGLINDILDMSKIESGKMTLCNEANSLVTLTTEISNIIQPAAWQKGQRFAIRLHDVEHETLCFDMLRLNQVLLNLLSNAVKYTPEGGAINADITESASTREGYAHFTFRVEDNGIGMKPEFLKDIFHAFTREQDSRVNKTEGTGLGMAITKMIVDMMEGTVAVESEPSKGTAFTVDLDLQLAPDGAPQALSLPPMRILVVCDDTATCRSAAGFLNSLGAYADIACCGADAIRMLAAAVQNGQRYDAILTDWELPDMDGLQALQAFRAQGGEKPPALIVATYDWARIAPKAVGAGADGFLAKPFFRSTLYQCMRQYVLHDALPTEEQDRTVNLAGKRILIAEDNALNQEIAKELLENVGAQVEVAGNGQECVGRFAHAAPGYFDLILMDVHMPVMDGYEATRRIRRLPRPDAAQIPIFAMTADAFAEDIKAARAAGMDSHLAKPLNIPAMLQEIQRFLDADP